MPLLNGPHDNEASAALSMAANRASKIDKLLKIGEVATARKFAAALLADVLEWSMTSGGSSEKARLFNQIGETAFQAYVRARDAEMVDRTPDREFAHTYFMSVSVRANNPEEAAQWVEYKLTLDADIDAKGALDFIGDAEPQESEN